MRTALILAAVLLATPAHAKPFMCVLFPKSCIEPTAAPEPAPAPVAVPPVVVKPPPKAKPLPRVIRPKYKPAPAKARRRAAMPSWCDRIPSGTTMERVGSVAPLLIGRPLTATERAQARACIASKKG
jgi:hypothetical protein